MGKLCPCIRGKIQDLLRMGVDFPLQVIETLRKKDRQAHYVKIGVSWTMNSKHLAQPPKGLSLACDIAPKALLKEKGWAPSHPNWKLMGSAGEELGLIWGGRWKARDLSHFELKKCECS